MISRLTLKNLILIDSCTIEFLPHFTALTGETGAGKTALTEGLQLALGARADTVMIRKGEEKASVEAVFEIGQLPAVQKVLQDAGIEFNPDEELIIRREINREGKNRAFANSQQVSLPVLQKLGSFLLELVEQHTYHYLTTAESQRTILDQFGNLQTILAAFQDAYQEELRLQKELDALLHQEAEQDKRRTILHSQLAEITAVKMQSGEEEKITEEHRRLAHAQEILEKIGPVTQGLSQFLPHLSRFHKVSSSLCTYDARLSQASSLLQDASIAMTEAYHDLQTYTDKLERDPHRFTYLEERLAVIENLKRKYGATFEEILAFQEENRQQLEKLDNLSEEIDQLRRRREEAIQMTRACALALTQGRKTIAEMLEKILTQTLQLLNMPGAEVHISVTPTSRSQWGDDLVQFWMRANIGEHRALIKDHASGGELSRLLFAVKIALAEKNQTPTLIFDEIDANVGGKTASVIGEQLKRLGQHRQVICITHFPQVAAQADHQFSVKKVESSGRTITQIQVLSEEQRETELLRMLGGKTLSVGPASDPNFSI
jgi:DNA repair protein RecN (Recombination protein N)